jgi:HEAT repeat protein
VDILCNDGQTHVRQEAATALGRIRGTAAATGLAEALTKNDNLSIVQTIIRSLGQTEEESAIPTLTDILQNPAHKPFQVEAARAIVKISQSEALLVFERVLEEDKNPETLSTVVQVLGGLVIGSSDYIRKVPAKMISCKEGQQAMSAQNQLRQRSSSRN